MFPKTFNALEQGFNKISPSIHELQNKQLGKKEGVGMFPSFFYNNDDQTLQTNNWTLK